MSDFNQYMLAQETRKKCYEQYGYAQQSLENAWIKERLAEIKSQYEPLATITDKLAKDGSTEERERVRKLLYSVAFYVVFGRLDEAIKILEGSIK